MHINVFLRMMDIKALSEHNVIKCVTSDGNNTD